MKPWLLNILACPMDKHHPLDAHFFSWETSTAEMEKINRESGVKNRYFAERYRHLAKQIAEGTISPASITAITDHTEQGAAAELLKDAVRAGNRFEEIEKPDVEQLLTEFPEEIDVLYRYLNLLDVGEGLLICSKCSRWYPIGRAVKGIPELMPDDLREREEELQWIKKWREKVPEEVINEGKPFKPEG
ncbi:MAG: Trm112 family protein [Candidatus Bathyarchaeia archaeon]